MKEFFIKLEEIYGKFHEKYLLDVKKQCGTCDYCCTSEFKYPPISSIEYDFIEVEQPDKFDDFKKFMTERHISRCPFYNKGCTIYQYRPLCCRLFGIFGSDIELPDNCIYREIVRKTEEKILFREEPFLREFQILKLNYSLKKEDDNFKKIPLLINLTEEYIAQNLIDSALEVLQIINEISPDADYYFYSGLISNWKGEWDKAAFNLEKAIYFGGAKRHPYIYEYLGLIYYKLNKPEEAKKMIEKAADFTDKY